MLCQQYYIYTQNLSFFKDFNYIFNYYLHDNNNNKNCLSTINSKKMNKSKLY